MAITRTPIVDDDGTGTTGTVIDNAWKQQLYDQIDAVIAASAPVTRLRRVGSASGVSNNPSGETFATPVGLGAGSLGPFDTIVVEIELQWSSSPANVTTGLFFQQGANVYSLLLLNTFGGPSAAGNSTIRVYIRRYSASAGYVQVLAIGGDTAPTQRSAAVAITDWSQAWAVGMNHTGIPNGNLNFKWTVTAIDGTTP